MGKIDFNGVEYDRPEDMPAEVRAQYEKAARNLPDRDQNGIPDLLEIDKQSSPLPPPVIPTAHVARSLPVKVDRVTRWLPWIVGGFILSVFACVALVFFGISSLMKNSGAYQIALETAKAHPTAQEILGTPIKDGFFTSGSVSESGSNGSADLEIPVSGSSQSGTLYVRADKENNTWRLIDLRLQVGDREYPLLP